MCVIDILYSGKLSRRKLLQFGRNKAFAEKTFANSLLVSLPKDAMPPILRRKLSRIATKPRNSVLLYACDAIIDTKRYTVHGFIIAAYGMQRNSLDCTHPTADLKV